MSFSTDMVRPGYRADPVADKRPAVGILVALFQAIVAVGAVGARFAAPGWWLIIAVFGGIGLIVLVPMIVATTIGIPVLRKGTRWIRAAVAASLAATDVALLTFALTLADFTDSASTNYVPIVTLIQDDNVVDENTAASFNTVANYALMAYLVAAGVAMVLGIAHYWMNRRPAPPPGVGPAAPGSASPAPNPQSHNMISVGSTGLPSATRM